MYTSVVKKTKKTCPFLRFSLSFACGEREREKKRIKSQSRSRRLFFDEVFSFIMQNLPSFLASFTRKKKKKKISFRIVAAKINESVNWQDVFVWSRVGISAQSREKLLLKACVESQECFAWLITWRAFFTFVVHPLLSFFFAFLLA